VIHDEPLSFTCCLESNTTATPLSSPTRTLEKTTSRMVDTRRDELGKASYENAMA